MIYCINCGEQLPEDSNYCSHCGAEVEANKEVNSVLEETEINNKTEAEQVKNKNEDKKDKWEPCPRCNSNRVEDIGKTKEWKYLLIIAIAYFIPSGSIYFLAGIWFAFLILNDIYYFFSSKTKLKCKDCAKVWKTK